MNKTAMAFLLAFLVGFLATCGPSRQRPADEPCAEIDCATGFSCDPSDGRCKPLEEADAGNQDAGVPPMDAGHDAGMACSPKCSGSTPICEPESRSCKVCIVDELAFEDPGCSSIKPKCYPKANAGTGDCFQCREDFDCGLDRVCNTLGGFCEPAPQRDGGGEELDGGPGDAGTPELDGGAGDAGEPALDAGQTDAGTPADAGLDAGEPYPDDCGSRSVKRFETGSNSIAFTADTTAGLDDYNGAPSGALMTCEVPAAQSGPDTVYEIVLEAASTLRVTATPTSGDPVIYMRGGDCQSGMQLANACSDSPLPLTPETFTTATLQPGSYFLFIDSYGKSGGVSSVTVTKQ